MSEGKLTVYYAGQDAFASQPTPFIGLDEANLYYGEQWAKQQTMTLDGQLTGCTFDLITAAQSTLIDRFRRSFQTLEVHQQDPLGSGVVFRSDLVEVNSIDFPASKWQGILPYSIRLKCYPSGYYSGAFGILDPKDSWAFQQQDNYVAQIVHSVSCRGMNTSAGPSNALNNAINWANAKRGTGDVVTPVFIQNVSPENFCLLTSNESVDRFNGTYTITDTYTNDLTRTGYGVIRYTTSVESGNGLITVGLQGTVKGCQQNISGVRAAFAGFNPTGAVVSAYYQSYGLNSFNPVPLSQSVTEDVYNATLSFAYQFDNSSLPPTYFDYTVNLTSGATTTASINGEIVTRGGSVKSKLDAAYLLLTGQDGNGGLKVYDIVAPYYNDFFPLSNDYPLNPIPVSSGFAINPSKGTISINAEFNNLPKVSDGIDYIDYTVDITPSVSQIGFQPILNGGGTYSIVDLGYGSRAAITIQGTALVSLGLSNVTMRGEATQAIQNAIYGIFADIVSAPENPVIEQQSINFNRTDNRAATFNYRWTVASSRLVATESTDFLYVNTFEI